MNDIGKIEKLIANAMTENANVECGAAEMITEKLAILSEHMYGAGVAPLYRDLIMEIGHTVIECVKAREALSALPYVPAKLDSLQKLLGYGESAIKGAILAIDGEDTLDKTKSIIGHLQEITEEYRSLLAVNAGLITPADKIASASYSDTRVLYSKFIDDQAVLQAMMQCHTVATHLYKRNALPPVSYLNTIGMLAEFCGSWKAISGDRAMCTELTGDIIGVANHLNSLLDEVNRGDLESARKAMST